jgi:outer membrane immunogenic protein
MRKILIGLLASSLVGLASPGMAQGVTNWTGFYVGAHAGYGWGTDGGVDFTDYPSGSFDLAFGGNLIPRSLATSPEGFVGGGHLGFNWHVAPTWVLGFEADLSGTDIRGDGRYTGVGPVFTTVHQSVEWLATVRGRAGVTFDRLLVYGTAGIAFGGVRSGFHYDTPVAAITGTGSQSQTRLGWTAGAGAEYAFAGNWSARVQWLYYDLGDVTASGPEIFNGVTLPYGLNATADASGHIVTFGISYRFGPAAPP